jgi:hypothetical protein
MPVRTRRDALRSASPSAPGANPDRAYALLALRVAGVSGACVNRLIVLRREWCDQDPSLDGLSSDRRLLFARWLFRNGVIAG